MLESSTKAAVEPSNTSKSRLNKLHLSPPSIVYWMRLGAGILAGILYNILIQLTGLNDVYSGTLGLISVGIGVYAVTIFVVKYLFGWGPDVLKGPNKHVSIGIGIFIIWMLFTSMIVYTILEGPALSQSNPSHLPLLSSRRA